MVSPAGTGRKHQICMRIKKITLTGGSRQTPHCAQVGVEPMTSFMLERASWLIQLQGGTVRVYLPLQASYIMLSYFPFN